MRLLRCGLARSRSEAQALIRAGRVLVNDARMEKPGALVPAESKLRLQSAPRFVSRGGEKLAGALADLGLNPAGRHCVDVGASTGGFSDCLLQAGARTVLAVDVGYGQLAWRLRNDPRVRVLERTNARHLRPEQIADFDPAAIGLVCVDVSFISATLLLPGLPALAPRAEALVLVKPQFEAGRGQVGRGGVVREDAVRQAAVARVRDCAADLGYAPKGQAESRLPGPRGNREIFLWLAPGVDC